MNKIFVYGTLKEGGRWHHLIEKATVIGYGKLSGYEMYVLEDGFMPMLKESPGDAVYGEVYEVNDTTLDRLRQLERQYKEIRANVMVDGMSVNCYVYIYSEYLAHYKWKRIPSGMFDIKK